ncbi:MAG: hypothetical protein ACTSRG_08350 [Candidatus Helarchaeota archaeon]
MNLNQLIDKEEIHVTAGKSSAFQFYSSTSNDLQFYPDNTTSAIEITELILIHAEKKGLNKLYKKKAELPSDIIKIKDELSLITLKLKQTKDNEEKVKLITYLNEFIKQNKEIIKNHFPDKLISVLNSL